MVKHWIVLLALGILATGCGQKSETKTETSNQSKQEARPASSGSGHAPAGVVPGSYEDWCGEHQVPETACTRCDPALIAAFKATNDWCAEHGLPESQCLVCNPELKIVRPPKPEGQ